ncbi:hypothetical protein JRO89_XS09G0147600 [Xanthoceras sorbifolium]|uniref:F-box domain-containing protein n=1 Tax=Xanthoceras sorbifolium TaxID=99658 RepID=A0ABQ8HLC7_9ROSI|nr:hypothetical protein JRO89_XS09G0147600 [Xanthoceras sorbifolium]
MDLIPNLPNHIALECLIRVPYDQFSRVASVSNDWKKEIELPEFRRLRKTTCHSQKIIVMSQARVDPNRKTGVIKRFANPEYRVTLLELDTGHWSELPPLPGFSSGLPMFCQLAAVGLNIVVMGGLDPVNWEVSNSVFIFNIVTGKWHRGDDMPGVRRSFYGCVSDHDRMVYVAGGHDADKNALRSAMAYDVAENKWIQLPDMAMERDECKGIFQDGKFHAIGGYCTKTQGRFEETAEVFDVATWQWGNVEENFLKVSTCPRTCTAGNDKDIYLSHEGDVVALKLEKWQALAKIPAEVCNVAYMTTWQGKLLVIGCARYSEPHMAYVLDLKSYKWTKIESRKEFCGHVQSGCYLEI